MQVATVGLEFPPRNHSSGGRERLGKITKMGDRFLAAHHGRHDIAGSAGHQSSGPRRPQAVYFGKANGRVHAMEIKRIGLDLAKYIFEVRAIDHDAKVVLRKTLK